MKISIVTLIKKLFISSEIAVDREVFRVFLGLLPLRLSPKAKRARK